MNFEYICTQCKKTFPISENLMVCPSCSQNQKKDEPLRGVLEVKLSGKSDKNFNISDLLPIEKEFFCDMPVGSTPLWRPKKLRLMLNMPELYIKDDGTNPTGSFKDRASFLVAAFAKKFKIKNITLASTGNAGSSMSGIGASADLDITLFLPKSAPEGKLVQAMQYGAKLVLVDGNYDKAYDLSLEYSQKFGGLNRNTAYNPMTIEGKKTVSLEIFKQLAAKAPDIVFVPTGDGCIIAGVYKGFKDLLDLKIISKMPTIYCVQAQNSDAIARAFETGSFTNIPTSTVADSICVDVPRNGYHALSLLKEYGGKIIRVSDTEIINAQHTLAKNSGIFTEPAGATAFAGLLKAKEDEMFPLESTVVVLTTGTGLKDIKTALSGVNMPKKAIKNLSEL